MNSGENYKHISHFNSGFDEKNHQQQQPDNSLPVPPKFLLNETVESQPEYSLPPMEAHNGDMFEHEYALPPDQIVTGKITTFPLFLVNKNRFGSKLVRLNSTLSILLHHESIT